MKRRQKILTLTLKNLTPRLRVAPSSVKKVTPRLRVAPSSVKKVTPRLRVAPSSVKMSSFFKMRSLLPGRKRYSSSYPDIVNADARARTLSKDTKRIIKKSPSRRTSYHQQRKSRWGFRKRWRVWNPKTRCSEKRTTWKKSHETSIQKKSHETSIQKKKPRNVDTKKKPRNVDTKEIVKYSSLRKTWILNLQKPTKIYNPSGKRNTVLCTCHEVFSLEDENSLYIDFWIRKRKSREKIPSNT
jgi:hypothetical protein